ncbi:MAG: HD domain-containing protein [Methanobacterium sp.]|jgi:putative hydrolase of HD superfamily|uniref:HAD family hydrolase n=1 Tax=Methanobacterium subterraneum TaxID=59277 RepID=A0A2H4VS51_9EURY|nr:MULTISPECIES: HD domain-containing protein [Methanobacterium]AUB60928.1 HAD family hydrolase [Methanobacterium subterraneum]MCC7560766.1 HD domain-containing protein [Methanobacterium sp.]
MIENIIERFSKAASMQRWNDHIRPVEFTELDKQAHKMVIAYVIARFEEDRMGAGSVDWISLIEGGIFEFLHRTVLTDIKPPVFHRMMKEKGEELNKHVFHRLESDMEGLDQGFQDRFRNYYRESPSTMERRILRAAHYLATQWEFKIIYHTAPFIYGIEKTKENIENQIEDHYDLIGVQKILLGKKSFGFIDLCGQLRFQKRWAHIPRIPETSVLGHMFIVAATSYLCTMEMGADSCSKRFYNNFYAGLFHDLPEVLTKDIISPVKGSVEGLKEIIKDYEDFQMKEELLPLLPRPWHGDMKYFSESEFENKIMDKQEVILGVSFQDLNQKYNRDEFSPLDGELLHAADRLAAFIEAKLSLDHGIKSVELEEAAENIYSDYVGRKISGIDFGRIFNYFR